MRPSTLVGMLVISLVPAIARADEEPESSMKIGRLEEIGVVLAGVGSAGLMAGGILTAMGFDKQGVTCRGVMNCTAPPPDEVPIGISIVISGAVLLGVGIPLAFIGKAKRHAREEREKKEREKQQQVQPVGMIVPTFGGAALSITF